ncbi:uncharacterized protein MICPUCDRAFT_33505 [Micromonas pusilla CCMP1545]|uniref:Bis(5'-adenosyl)-triphosphatase n=1 Tax=Micromonas pusilla (strain CCMP1545) TaxID=564608 RepID=C1MTC8_MICPC|nr:uncharacterized protein MICPUCDRAFT_33505 [Micromonas pusilla CCMP1545]EEH56920.1 predicted protein [Micromonas pusilla CCMP1545]|eukprot:XP_003058465.1 predicted protein [Micromonas pusilla CCMP1545]
MSSSRTIVNDHYSFGPLDIPRSQVFAETPLSYGIVNLKPVVPGHVLVVTRRIIKRFESLTEDELVDVWTLAKKVGSALEKHHGATSLTYAIQDGPSAGQTIPHVHIHVLPRRDGDFENNDEVYDAVDASERAIGGGGERLNLDAERVIRTPEEMAAEAATIRKLLFNNGVNPNAR